MNNNNSGSYSVNLPKDLTIANVAEVKGWVDEALHKGQTVSVDASALETIDTAGVQLLLVIGQHGRGGAAVAVEDIPANMVAYGEAMGIPADMLSQG